MPIPTHSIQLCTKMDKGTVGYRAFVLVFIVGIFGYLTISASYN